MIVAKCASDCPACDGHCHCVFIVDAPESMRPDICKNFGCLFGSAYHIKVEYDDEDTIREYEYECDVCDRHCRLCFDGSWIPVMDCPLRCSGLKDEHVTHNHFDRVF